MGKIGLKWIQKGRKFSKNEEDFGQKGEKLGKHTQTFGKKFSTNWKNINVPKKCNKMKFCNEVKLRTVLDCCMNHHVSDYQFSG